MEMLDKPPVQVQWRTGETYLSPEAYWNANGQAEMIDQSAVPRTPEQTIEVGNEALKVVMRLEEGEDNE